MPVNLVLWLAVYSKRYVRGVVDFLAAGRVAGLIMVFGLYSRLGNSVGAFGSGLSAVGLYLQRNWAETVYPWLEINNWHRAVGTFLKGVSRPFNPFVTWEMNPLKFPINSYELFFLAMFRWLTKMHSRSARTKSRTIEPQKAFGTADDSSLFSAGEHVLVRPGGSIWR